MVATEPDETAPLGRRWEIKNAANAGRPTTKPVGSLQIHSHNAPKTWDFLTARSHAKILQSPLLVDLKTRPPIPNKQPLSWIATKTMRESPKVRQH